MKVYKFFRNKKTALDKSATSYHFFVSKTFDMTLLKRHLETNIQGIEKKQYSIEINNSILGITLNLKEDLKKQTRTYTSYLINESNNGLVVNCEKITEFIQTAKKETTYVDLYEVQDKLIGIILKYVNKGLDRNLLNLHLQAGLEFIIALPPRLENFILAALNDDEICLVCLGITNLKSELFDVVEKASFYFLATSKRTMILQKNGASFSLFDITDAPLQHTKKIGKDRLEAANFSFDTEFFNDTLFYSLKDFFNQSYHKKTAYYTDIIFDRYANEQPHFNYLKELYEFEMAGKNNLGSVLKSILVLQFAKKKCQKDLVFQQSDFIDLAYSEKTIGAVVNQILEDWKIPLMERFAFLELLTKEVGNYKLKNLAVLYDATIEGIMAPIKLAKDTIPFRLNYARFLNDTKQYQKAVPVYDILLENLPDDSMLELISDTKTNVLNGADCNPIKIQLLEELSAIKIALHQSNNKELHALACLQPLVLDRLTQLVESGILTEKARVILSLFKVDSFCTVTNQKQANTTRYSKKELFELVVPTCFKEAKNFLNSFTKLIAQVEPPDYKQVITYSEKLSKTNYPEAASVLAELVAQLQLDKPECYIGNGAYAKGIIGVEGVSNFIILGKSHLEPESPFYLTANELKFNLALELTHILFEHTRLTSKDVWRGAKSKGMSLAGALLVALPMVSTIGTFAGKFMNIKQYTGVFSRLEKVTNVVEKGQTALSYGEKITEKFTSEQKESELLATSRLMEISADRVGLLLTDDLKSCIAVLLKCFSNDALVSQEINENGLHEFLMQQNDENEFVHQELVIRIKTLCSFYLQQDFDEC